MRIAAHITLFLALAAFLCAALLAALPSLLTGHEYRLRVVRPRFKTPVEQFELANRASQNGEHIFNALYDPLGNEQIDAYVPPRASIAYWILRAVSANRMLASKEDFLPAPPAPMAFEFIDKENATPLRVTDCNQRRMQWLFRSLCTGTGLLIVVLLLKRRISTQSAASMSVGRS